MGVRTTFGVGRSVEGSLIFTAASGQQVSLHSIDRSWQLKSGVSQRKRPLYVHLSMQSNVSPCCGYTQEAWAKSRQLFAQAGKLGRCFALAA